MKSLRQFSESVLWPEEVGTKSDGLGPKIQKASEEKKIKSVSDFSKYFDKKFVK